MSILNHATFPANEDYHANDRLSYTGFKVFRDHSPLAYKHRFIDGHDSGQTPAMRLGSLCHLLLLEPDLFDDEYGIAQEFRLTGKAAKGAFVDWMLGQGIDVPIDWEGLSADALRSIMHASHKVWVTQEEVDHAMDIIKPAHWYFMGADGSLDKGKRNVEAAFEAEIEGVPVQCKCDYIREDGRVLDLKTTADLTKWRDGLNRGDMIMGDAWYRMVIEAAAGVDPGPIIYVGASTVAPYQSLAMSHDADLYPFCKRIILRDLELFRKCKESGEWPGLDLGIDEVQTVQLSEWTRDRLEAEALGEFDIGGAYDAAGE